MNEAALWVKICGATTPDAVAGAIAAGADAVGFVFAPSVRRVTPAQAAQLAAPARGRLRCVAVMQHPQTDEVAQVLAEFRPDVLQTDLQDLAALDLPATLERLPVLRAGREAPASLPPRAVFEGPVSGAGVAPDWAGAVALRLRGVEILREANVDAAVRTVRPWGGDVSSGVERAPGIKDMELIARFVAAARAACREG